VINWHEFDWQSFSTLATGLAAVIGAVVVGLRQAKITERQANIQERQVALEAMNLKAELFERRLSIYNAALDFLGLIINLDENSPRLIVENKGFFSKVRESHFLFRPEVAQSLERIIGDAFHLQALIVKSVNGLTEDEAERLEELVAGASLHFRSLHDVFGPDLALNAHDLKIA
jgi:hypothetical protein